MSEKELNDELADMEAALATVGPRPSRLDRDRVMYLAGQASANAEPGQTAPTTRWAWPVAFGAMTAVAAALLVMTVLRPRTEIGKGVEVASSPRPETKELEPSARSSGIGPWDQQEGLGEDGERIKLDGPYFRQLDRVLALRADPWDPADSSPTDTQPTVPATPYSQLLESLLDPPAMGDPASRPSLWESFPKPGVES